MINQKGNDVILNLSSSSRGRDYPSLPGGWFPAKKPTEGGPRRVEMQIGGDSK